MGAEAAKGAESDVRYVGFFREHGLIREGAIRGLVQLMLDRWRVAAVNMGMFRYLQGSG